MEFWIQPISAHYSTITSYVKPFSPPELCSQPWLIAALTPVEKIDNEVHVFQTE
jgi:hypothetical protein